MSTSELALDQDGYLLHLSDWNCEVARALARNENIELSDQHWEIIEAVQQFYREYEIAPASRALVRYIRQKLGPGKRSQHLSAETFSAAPGINHRQNRRSAKTG